jgi:hypothetical protein
VDLNADTLKTRNQKPETRKQKPETKAADCEL